MGNRYRYHEISGWPVVFLCVPLVIWAVMRIIAYINWDIDVTGHLKRAADANTIELATKEMETVINYLEYNNITNGYTSVFYRTPDEDVAFWYQNLKASLNELKQVPSTATQLEKSNVLMKLRETLVDNGQSTSVTEPEGISVFPNNVAWAWFGVIGFICCLGACWQFHRWIDSY